MAAIHLRGLVKRYGAVTVIPSLDLEIRDREFVVFVPVVLVSVVLFVSEHHQLHRTADCSESCTTCFADEREAPRGVWDARRLV